MTLACTLVLPGRRPAAAADVEQRHRHEVHESGSSSSQISLAIGSRPKKLSLVSITPFGRPVVPLEYSWNATSSAALGVPGSVAGCAASSAS